MTSIIVGVLIGGIILGLALWLSIKIVDKENRSNTLIGGLVIGIILQAILLLPGFIGILIALLVLAGIFNSYDLEIVEAIIVLIILVVIKMAIGYLVGLLMQLV